MKNTSKLLVVVLMASVVLSSCGRKPVKEIDIAKKAVAALEENQADKYIPAEFSKLNDRLAIVMDEVNLQKSRIFKNYKYAKEMLAQVLSDADNLNMLLPAKIEAAKSAASVLLVECRIAVDNAGKMLKKVQVNRSNKELVEGLKNELKELEETIPLIEADITSRDYFSATSRGKSVSDRADEVINLAEEQLTKARK